MSTLLVLLILMGLAVAFYYSYSVPYYRMASKAQAEHVDTIIFPVTSNDIPKYQKRLQHNLDSFYKLYQESFKYGACDLEKMHMHARRVSKNAYEILNRLPNDYKKREAIEEAIKNIVHILKVHMEDVKARCKLPNIHLDPIDDFYYVTMLKAFNDG